MRLPAGRRPRRKTKVLAGGKKAADKRTGNLMGSDGYGYMWVGVIHETLEAARTARTETVAHDRYFRRVRIQKLLNDPKIVEHPLYVFVD